MEEKLHLGVREQKLLNSVRLEDLEGLYFSLKHPPNSLLCKPKSKKVKQSQ
jgi:hypothetical protein